MNLLVPSACMFLLAAFVAIVVHPVLTSRDAWRRQTGAGRQRLVLTERKEQLYASIKELEFDRSLAKMSQEDYDALRAELETEALRVLAQLESLERGDGIDPVLRARVEADVATFAGSSEAETEASETGDPAFCPACGKARQSRHRFCPHCGESLSDPAPGV
jgi:hypothetical protein